jgi:hypothetical protein
MSQQDFKDNLETAIESVDQLMWYNKLLEMALQQTNTFSEENFDRISVLLESHQSFYNGFIDELQWALKQLQLNTHNLQPVSCVSSSTALQVTTTVITSTSTP